MGFNSGFKGLNKITAGL